jgi:hypothetical protein
MIVMKLYTSIMLMLCAGFGLDAANFSGKWALPAGRGGAQTILMLNQVGNEVVGTLSARGDVGTGAPVNQEILDGKADGDVITFYVWTGNDVPAKQMYKGTMSGDEITFEITGGPARRGGGGFGPNGQGRGAAGGRGPATPPPPPIAKRIK